jgi:hypothetical protein
MDAHTPDLSRIAETGMFPSLAGVGRLINSVTMRHVPAYRRFAHADVDDVRVGQGNVYRPDRTRLKYLSDTASQFTPASVVFQTPPSRGPEIIDLRLRWHPGNGGDTTAAERADEAILKKLKRIFRSSWLRHAWDRAFGHKQKLSTGPGRGRR